MNELPSDQVFGCVFLISIDTSVYFMLSNLVLVYERPYLLTFFTFFRWGVVMVENPWQKVRVLFSVTLPWQQ